MTMAALDVLLSTLPVEAAISKHSVDISFPDLYHLEFRSDGTISLWSISRIFEVSRNLALRRFNLGNMRGRLLGANTVFLRQAIYKLSSKLFLPHSVKRSWKHKVNVNLVSCGNSSFGLKAVLFTEDGCELASMDLSMVWIDRASRKPVSIPNESRVFFPSSVPPTQQARYAHPKPPMHMYRYTVTVEPHHLDFNQHTNQARYIQYCVFAAKAAVTDCFFTDLCHSEFKVKELITVYDKESMEGDELVVLTWQDKDSASLIYFSIRLKDKLIFHCRWIMDI